MSAESLLFEKLSAKIRREMKRLRTPGASVGIWHKGAEYAAGFGVTSVENPLPVTADTLFQAGSITKTFTGTLLMRLAEQGKIDLDAPVKTYLKDFKMQDKRVEKEVSIRHLLTHLGGWVGDYFNDFGTGDDALEKMVKEISKLPQIHPMGKIWSYNNTGFNIAARVIEVVSGKPYERAAQEALLGPLGLKMTFFYPNDVLFTHRFVVGHRIEKGKVVVARPWAIGRAGNGVGGVISSARDLLAYARFHMGNGGGVLSKRSLEAMRVQQAEAGLRGGMGITWFIRRAGDLTYYAHGGATRGQQAFLFFIPKEKFAFVILTNSDEGGVLTANAARWALKMYFNAEAKIPKPIERPADELEEFLGRYRIGTECFDLKRKGKFVMYHHIPLGGFPTPETPPGPAAPPARFLFYEADKMIGLDEPFKNEMGDFIRGEDGRVEYFRISGRAHKKIS